MDAPKKKPFDIMSKIDALSGLVKMIIIVLSLIVIALCAFWGCSDIMREYQIEEDGYWEEIVEDIIEHHTGISIDISEKSPEVN